MSQTELWIEQARQHLEKTCRGGRRAQADSLGDHMTRIDVEQIRADLGCGDDCVTCSWGSLGGQPLGSEPCRLLLLQKGVEELQQRDGGKASLKQEAARLLRLLNGLPPRR